MPWSRKSRAIALLHLWAVRPVQSLSACTVELYLYSLYGSYNLYRASVPVQYSYTSTPPIGRTACTYPQYLYSTAIPLLPLLAIRPVQSLSACTVQLYLYSPYWPYSLYRASVPVQYSYNSTPPIGHTACTDPQCLYNDALYLYLYLYLLWLYITEHMSHHLQVTMFLEMRSNFHRCGNQNLDNNTNRQKQSTASTVAAHTQFHYLSPKI